jgi:hypothetical protein
MTSDNILRFWPWVPRATEARRHAENRGGLQKYPWVRLATLDIIPADNALKHGENLLLLRAVVTSSPTRLLEALRHLRGCWKLFATYAVAGGTSPPTVRVPTDTCNETCIALSGSEQRHLFFDLLGRSAWSLLLASLALLGIIMIRYFDLLRCSAWSLPASRALLVIISLSDFDILCAGRPRDSWLRWHCWT